MSDTDVLQTHTLQVIGPPVPAGITAKFLWPLTANMIRETEENLTDLLPPNYSVVIREWDEEEK